NPCASGLFAPGPIASPVAVATDSTGNMYVAGFTNETDFPITTGNKTIPVFCSQDGGQCEPAAGFVTKFSPQGKLIYSTFLPSGLQAYAMAVDAAGNAYVVGDDDIL